MTITRQHLTVALLCGGIGSLFGMAGGVFAGSSIPDVLVVAVAALVLIVWTAAAVYAGLLLAAHRENERVNEALDVALQLREEGERIRLAEALAAQRARIEAKYTADTEALHDAVREDR